jgi:hypothetical protein
MKQHVPVFEIRKSVSFPRDHLWVMMWAKWADKFYEGLFLDANDVVDLYNKYKQELSKYKHMNVPGELLYALKYFFHYRYSELKNADPLRESYEYPREKPKWRKLTQLQYEYMEDVITGHLPVKNEYAEGVLATIKSKNLWCTERQYDYLQRVIKGFDKPEHYGPRN